MGDRDPDRPSLITQNTQLSRPDRTRVDKHV